MLWIPVLWVSQSIVCACYTPETFSSWKRILSINELLQQDTRSDSEHAFKHPRVNILEVSRTYCSKAERINQNVLF